MTSLQRLSHGNSWSEASEHIFFTIFVDSRVFKALHSGDRYSVAAAHTLVPGCDMSIFGGAFGGCLGGCN
jgi:hypothetical protein